MSIFTLFCLLWLSSFLVTSASFKKKVLGQTLLIYYAITFSIVVRLSEMTLSFYFFVLLHFFLQDEVLEKNVSADLKGGEEIIAKVC